ncbi:MAG: TnpV protein [Clostridiales bacterium]|nr:TnpV protein [Clostridiales bacterium]
MKKFEKTTVNIDDFPSVIDDDMFGVEYHLEGDRYIPRYKEGAEHPDLPKAFFEPVIRQIDPPLGLLNAVTERGIGKFGRIRFNFLRKYNIPLYARLVATAALPLDLEDANDEAWARVLALFDRLMEEGKAEALKEHDAVKFALFRGECARRAEEQVIQELLNEWQAEIN